ncbi:ATP-binding domain-containing protein [Paraburkholderia sp. CI3]|uniref:ATP-binding domain-containing protein n=1 Tax=Paraburkholderia sp. CI3 TaxID=2991060 RepID=UPI003D1E62C0
MPGRKEDHVLARTQCFHDARDGLPVGAGAASYAGVRRRLRDLDRAKGLEWKRVEVATDFRFKIADGRLTRDEDEMRLLYVAVTRAQHVLYISELREELLRLFNSRR